jgi:hypothetical protein
MRRGIGTAAAIIILAAFPVHAHAATATAPSSFIASFETFAAEVVAGIEYLADAIGQNLAAVMTSTPGKYLSYSAAAAAYSGAHLRRLHAG